MSIPEETVFVQRAILASAAGPEHVDAARQLSELFSPIEFAAWREAKLTRSQVKVVIGRDGGRESFAVMSPPGIVSSVEGTLMQAIDELTREVRAWADDASRSGTGLGHTIRKLSNEELRAFIVARAAPNTPGMEFRVVWFHETDGTAMQRAVPFTDGRPPREISIPDESGKLRKFVGEYVSSRLRYVPA